MVTGAIKGACCLALGFEPAGTDGSVFRPNRELVKFFSQSFNSPVPALRRQLVGLNTDHVEGVDNEREQTREAEWE